MEVVVEVTVMKAATYLLLLSAVSLSFVTTQDTQVRRNLVRHVAFGPKSLTEILTA